MATVTSRKFFDELGMLVGKPVAVVDTQGKTFDGDLLGYDINTLSLCLGNVNTERGKVHRLFLSGANITRILASERPFNIEGLKERLEKVFPNMVQLFPEAGVVVVMGKIRLNETGVIDGTGPAADRVKDIFQRFKAETQA